jgi:hypothetical protein
MSYNVSPPVIHHHSPRRGYDSQPTAIYVAKDFEEYQKLRQQYHEENKCPTWVAVIILILLIYMVFYVFFDE